MTATLAPIGTETPRLHTEPRRTLEDSLGHEVIRFAEDVLGEVPDPWQRWALVHALEVDANGGYRFSTWLLLIARQCGKTWLLRTIILWAMYTGRVRLVLGVAQSIGMARETWQAALDSVETSPVLRGMLKGKPRNVNGEQEFKFTNGARYKIAANTRSAGRGLSVDLLVLDELREHRDWAGWAALAATTAARPGALILCSSNAGDMESVVLNTLRSSALAGRDVKLGIAEWSAPDGCALDDVDGICQANPAIGHGRMSLDSVLSALATNPPNVFRAERLCQFVDATDAAVDSSAWADCSDVGGVVNSERRVVCFDVSPVSGHATLVVAGVESDGRVRIEVAGAWRDTAKARVDLPGLIARVDPESCAWFPTGPGAALGPVLKALPGSVELQGARVAEACQHFADLVGARRLLHPGDPLLDAQVSSSHKLKQGDGWRFSRYGQASCDAAYAAAGAVLLAESLGPAPRKYTGPLVV